MPFDHSDFSPTAESALLAKREGSLSEWVQKLLLSEGNVQLAKTLSDVKPVAIEMANFPLIQLKKIVGPEEVEEHRQSPDVWEKQVAKLAKMIKDGYEPAPLIVTDYWNYLEIADGNHRHEALLRVGKTRYWTIFLIKHEEGREYLQNIIRKYAD